MRKAFTLVEVIIATILVVISCFALIQSSENNLKIVELSLKKESSNEFFSLILLNEKDNWDKIDKNLYDFVKDKFDIKNDDLVNLLKEEKISYSQEESNKISLLDFNDSLLNYELKAQLDSKKDLLPKIVVSKIIMYSPKSNAFGFTFKTEFPE